MEGLDVASLAIAGLDGAGSSSSCGFEIFLRLRRLWDMFFHSGLVEAAGLLELDGFLRLPVLGRFLAAGPSFDQLLSRNETLLGASGVLDVAS